MDALKLIKSLQDAIQAIGHNVDVQIVEVNPYDGSYFNSDIAKVDTNKDEDGKDIIELR